MVDEITEVSWKEMMRKWEHACKGDFECGRHLRQTKILWHGK